MATQASTTSGGDARDQSVLLEQAADAIARSSWHEAFDFLSQADAVTPLSAEDLERLADIADTAGYAEACIAALDRAYSAHLERGNRRRAAFTALQLAQNHSAKLAQSVAAGWLGQAVRLLENEPEGPEHGHLAHILCHVTLSAGNLDQALEHAKRTLEIGERSGDRDLQALGLDDQGLVRIARGEVTEGLALLDEAVAAAIGASSLNTRGLIYCHMITSCLNIGDYRRAGEWIETARRWRDGQTLAGFPGLCRVNRAAVMRVRGEWANAEEDARAACEELLPIAPSVAAAAFYELGEIRLRLGDLAQAEEAFEQAHQLGHEPQPGLALLRLAQGRPEAAATMIKNAGNWLLHKQCLDAQVEIAIAAGDLETARSTANEMQAAAEIYTAPATQARAQCALGAVQLAEGDSEAALASLRQGFRLWQDVEAPYEAAKARMLLAAAYRASGDLEGAALELRAALAAFKKLGAALDVRRATELLDAVSRSGQGQPGTAESRRTTKTFMFTDVVRSTNLMEAIGDEAWDHLLTWHDATLRTAFVEHRGQEVKHEGDGFFVTFDSPSAAIECAVAIQRSLSEHRSAHGFAPQVRIGLHAAEAIRRGHDFSGKAINLASRITALAKGDEILASQETVTVAHISLPVSEPRSVKLKGFTAPIQVAAIEWR
jgi:class 3 adenylate cyclase